VKVPDFLIHTLRFFAIEIESLNWDLSSFKEELNAPVQFELISIV
jgi:hypothetical protein